MALGATSVATVRLVIQFTPEALVPETDQIDAQVETTTAAEEVLVEESLVEEVSIDGMCGVY